MKLRKDRPIKNFKDSNFRCALEELKFVKSFNDLKIIHHKIQYKYLAAFGGLERLSNRPLSLQIEPTNHCNVNCICCSSSRSSRGRGYMDFGLFKKIIDGASNSGVKRVRLFVHGEPLLHPQIVDMIRYIKSKDLTFNLTTNGMLFGRELSNAILLAGVTWADHITFSILGGSKQVHEKIMRKSDYGLITKNLFDFMHLRRELGVNGPVIQTILHTMPENEHDMEKYLHAWQGKVDHVRLGGNISVSYAEHGREKANTRARKKTCVYLWERMTVFWNGDFSLCSRDVDGDWVLGNLGEQGIQEAWNHAQLKDVRRIHSAGRFHEFPYCYSCDLDEV